MVETGQGFVSSAEQTKEMIKRYLAHHFERDSNAGFVVVP